MVCLEFQNTRCRSALLCCHNYYLQSCSQRQRICCRAGNSVTSAWLKCLFETEIVIFVRFLLVSNPHKTRVHWRFAAETLTSTRTCTNTFVGCCAYFLYCNGILFCVNAKICAFQEIQTEQSVIIRKYSVRQKIINLYLKIHLYYAK
jgi:hypothetical protein